MHDIVVYVLLVNIFFRPKVVFCCSPSFDLLDGSLDEGTTPEMTILTFMILENILSSLFCFTVGFGHCNDHFSCRGRWACSWG